MSPPLTPLLWGAAVAPVALLFALVASGRVKTHRAAVAVVVLTVVLGATLFRAGPALLAFAVAKGLWLGLWILLVVWLALLLYHVASVVGLDRIGEVFTGVLARRRENLLLVAWLFPSFIQGVAGFGTPIAVAAPLLVAMGWPRSRAVLYPLIGYHWSVTFGSMGSSFYMAALTAQLGGAEQTRFAAVAAGLLGVGCLVSGALVLVLDGGWAGLREGWRVLFGAGVPMAVTLVATAVTVPAIATLAASAVGFVAVFALGGLQRRRARASAPARSRTSATAPAAALSPAPSDGSGPVAAGDLEPSAVPHDVSEPGVSRPAHAPAQLLAPYLYLIATALPVFLWPPSRAWVRVNLAVAPDFPATATALGWANEPISGYTPIAAFGHPAAYILLACVLGYLTYRRVGLWRSTDGRALLVEWARSLPAASVPILLLGCVATVLIDTGMVSVLARGITTVTQGAYPLLAPWIGAVGSFMTGSTTTSNALFAALQNDVAELLDVAPAVLLGAQTAGGNVGNSLAPVVILIGATAVGTPDRVGEILRASLGPAAVLLALLSAQTMLLAALLPV